MLIAVPLILRKIASFFYRCCENLRSIVDDASTDNAGLAALFGLLVLTKNLQNLLISANGRTGIWVG